MNTKQIAARLLMIPLLFVAVETVSAQATLPPQIRAYLNRNYPRWKLNATANYCPRDFKRSLVTGDFDADGQRDYALKFMSGRQGYIVAFLNRRTDFRAYVLESGSASEMKRQGLSIARRGETYPEIVNDNFDRQTRRLRQDAPVGGTCESSAYLYIYENGVFRRAFVSD